MLFNIKVQMIGYFKYNSIHPYGCVYISESEYYPLKNMQPYHNYDIVEYDIENQKIINLLQRVMKYIPGILDCRGPVMGIPKKGTVIRKFIPCFASMPPIFVSTKKTQSYPNEYGIVEIIAADEKLHGNYCGKIGTPGDIESEKEYLMYCHNINIKKRKKNDDPIIDLTPNRINLEDIYTISIDPRGCTDIDDALSFIHTQDSDILYIHIADVSSFFDETSKYNTEGMERIESLYLEWKQYNMYPDELVKEMSLLQDQKRRAYTIEIKYKNMMIVDVNCYKSFIRVNKNMSYDDFDDNLKELYDFVKQIYGKSDYDTHKLVETCMILCNTHVAKLIYEKGKNLPICRSHKKPDLEAIKHLTLNSEIESHILHYYYNKASYVIGKQSHETIGVDMYSHFTSPIRRFVDVLTHRLLYNSMHNINNMNNMNIIIHRINIMHNLIQKANRESKSLMMIYELYKNNNTVIDTNGYIINICHNYIIAYIPEYDIEIKCLLYSSKIANEINVNYTFEKISIEYDNRLVELELQQKISLKMVIMFLEPQFSKKIQGEITCPRIFDIDFIYDE